MLPIYKTLAEFEPLNKVINVACQVHEEIAPQDTPTPYVVWQVIGGHAHQHLDTPAHLDDTQYQIMVYSPDRQQAYAVRELVRQALEMHSWILNPNLTNYEDDTRLYARGFDGNWIVGRDTVI